MDITDVDRLRKAVVYARDEKVGSVDEIYVDDETSTPTWATVSTGLFGTKKSFVPIDDAQLIDDDRLEVTTDKDTIKDAPRIDVNEHLSPAEERRLYQHYGRSTRYDELESRYRDRAAADHGRRDATDDDRRGDGGTYDVGNESAHGETTMGTRPQVTEDYDRPREADYRERGEGDSTMDRARMDREGTRSDQSNAEQFDRGTERSTDSMRTGHLRAYGRDDDGRR